MSNKKSLTPLLRFKNFNEEWEQCELVKAVTKFSTGLNPRNNFQLNNGGENYYVTIKNFEQGYLYLDDRCDKVDNRAMFLIQQRSDLKKNDILFSSIGRIGDCYLIKNTPKNWNINESVFALRPNIDIIEPIYLVQAIHSNTVHNNIISNVTGSTFKSIKMAQLKMIEISVPSKEEQEKVGILFSNLDKLITFHQHKYEQLLKIKKGLISKMFPQNNSNIPEIRFNGYTENWKQCELNDISLYRSSNISASNVNDYGKYALYDANQKIGYTNKQNIDVEYLSIIKDGSGVGRVRLLPKNSYFIGTMGGIIPKNINVNFLNCIMNNLNFALYVTGVTIPHIYFSDYCKSKILIPKANEQSKIGTLFSNLDKLINLHKLKYEKLKNIKESLLSKMFV